MSWLYVLIVVWFVFISRTDGWSPLKAVTDLEVK